MFQPCFVVCFFFSTRLRCSSHQTTGWVPWCRCRKSFAGDLWAYHTKKNGQEIKSTWQQNTAHTNLITFFDVVVIVVILILTTQSQSYYFDNLFFLIESLHTPWLPKPWSSPIDFHDHFEIRRGVWNRQAPFQNLKGSLQSQVMPSCFLVSSLFLAAELIGGAGIVCLPFGE